MRYLSRMTMKPVLIRFTEKQLKFLRQEAKRLEVPVAQVVRQLVNVAAKVVVLALLLAGCGSDGLPYRTCPPQPACVEAVTPCMRGDGSPAEVSCYGRAPVPCVTATLGACRVELATLGPVQVVHSCGECD